MKIVKLTAENFMRLVAVEITPQGNAILITGKNAAGKSSVLDAIMAAFCGKKYQPAKPIRDGQDHAEIVVETENYIIKRTFTAKGGGTVTVSNAEGMKASSPQGLLDKLVGEIAFEPMAFFKDSKDVKRQRQQRDTLMKLVGLDFTDIDAEIASVKNERSAVKTGKDTYDFEAGQIPELPDVGDEFISMTELTEKLTVATQFNKKHAEDLHQVDVKQQDIKSLQKRVEELKERIALSKQRYADTKANVESQLINLKQQLANAEATSKREIAEIEANQAAREKDIEKIQAEQEQLAESLEPLIDLAAINKEIEDADAHNNNIRLTNQRTELLKKSAAKSREFAGLGQKMKTLEAKKAERLAAVKMPIEKLSVNEETILYDNIPLAQVNDSMQLRIAVAISMALNPKLKVILLKGNDLDSASLDTVCKLAKAKDYQIWVERVEESGKIGFYIEEGEIKAVNGQKPKKE